MDDYDEFGNYIGALSDSDDGASEAAPDLDEPAPLEGFDEGDESGDDRMSELDEEDEERVDPSSALIRVDEAPQNAVVLHENKKYYPSAVETYGEDVETLVMEEDAQPLTQPIIEPVKTRRFAIEEEGLPETRFDREFMMNLMNFPDMVRNVVVAGHLHSGKTRLMDMLVEETHKMEIDMDRNVSVQT
jgi:U5 small nuclear ribonucleoprotein component